jgi:mannose-6-phosphate isomerase-like protein (cupin superfamily)
MSETSNAGRGAIAPFMLAPGDRPRALNVVGEHITVLADAARTGGPELFHQQGEAGKGPPPHKHGWDETFYILTGELDISVGDETRRLGPGSVAHVPAGVMHWFRFITDGEMISMSSRGGAAGLFADFDREIPPGPPDVGKLVEIAARHGATIAPPPG